MKKILITGVAGLFGSHFSKYLIDRKYEVIGIDDLSGGYLDFIDKRMIKNGRFYKVNLSNQKKLEEIFAKHKPDYVYHFAAYAAEGLSPFIRNYNYTNNLISSVNIINNCIKYNTKKIVFTSSMAVYGHGKPPFKEEDPPKPADPYGIAKYSVEIDLKLAYEQFGLRYTIVRPHNVVGIYQNIWDKYRNVIGIWVRRSICNEPLLIYGDGNQTRAFSDIKYYMKPLEKLLNTGDGEIFNIGADKEYKLKTIASLVKKIASEHGLKVTISHVEKRHEVKNAFSSHKKAKKVLDFTDNTNIEEMIREMFSWAKTQPKRKVKSMRYEIDKNIYSFWK